MAITLREIDKTNWMDVLRLKLPAGQERFVASNVFSLAEAKIFPSMAPLAIYAGDVLVGFTMYGRDADDNNVWIYRLMIGDGYQRKGYGRAAMGMVIERLRSEPDCPFIKISWDHGNTAAETLYESLGFHKTGEIKHDEIVAQLDL